MQLRNLSLPATSGQLVVGRGCLTFTNAGDTSLTTAAQFSLYDGEGIGGQLLMFVNLLAGTSKEISPGTHVVPFEHGLFYQLWSGAIVGNVSARLADSEAEWNAILAYVSNLP